MPAGLYELRAVQYKSFWEKVMEEQNKPLNPQEQTGPEPSQPRTLKPHRGGIVLALGILGIVVCFILGIVAWVMGKNDLNEMDAGIMDPSGRGLTQAGKICGMVSVVLQIIVLLIWLLVAAVAGAGAVIGG